MRDGLSFGPFESLSLAELNREERYWWRMAESAPEGGSVALTAERHRLRCVETMRAKYAGTRDQAPAC